MVDLAEGVVVLVLGRLDTRVRDSAAEAVYGTVVELHRSSVTVLLPNGDLWRGPEYEVAPQDRAI